MLIEELKAALPGIIIMILEPFILEKAIVEEQWRTTKCRDLVRNEVQKRGRMAKPEYTASIYSDGSKRDYCNTALFIVKYP